VKRPAIYFRPAPQTQEPTADRAGVAWAVLVIPRGEVKDWLRIECQAGSDFGGGPRVHVRVEGGPEWEAGIAWAGLRWSPGEGPPDLTLEWPGPSTYGTGTYALVSDALRLATDRDAQWSVRAFWDALPSAGRGSERGARVATYRTTILAMKGAGWSESRITAETVLRRLGRTGDQSQLRDDTGGWVAFRRNVYRQE